MKNITVLIADDHSLIRESWTYLLSNIEGFQVVGQCSNGFDALKKAMNLQPDVILLDINMPGINGFETLNLLAKYCRHSKIVGVSTHVHPSFAIKMVRKGAMGYVTKSSPYKELLKAITEVHEGRKFMCRETDLRIAEESNKGTVHGKNALSQREIQVVDLIRNGLSLKEIAESLSLSVKTVEVHRYNVMRKLNLKNTAALVNYVHSIALL